MAEDKELKSIKSFLRSVLITSKDGVPAYNLQREYKEMVGDFLPFKKLGYPTLEDFIQSVPDVVELRWTRGELYYIVVPDEKTAHIHDLVSKQKSNRKLKKPARRPRGGGGSRFLPRHPYPQPDRAPRPRYPAKHKTILPTPMGIPCFTTPTHVFPTPTYVEPRPNIPSPITVRVGNSAMGTRTVKVGRLFSRAMNDASAERASEDSVFNMRKTAIHVKRPTPKLASRFEVPPRFRKQQESSSQYSSEPQPSTRRPSGPKVTFPTIENGEKYMRVLTEYCQERKEILKFDSMPARVGSATGYVSATKLNNTLYGSEDVYRTAKEAEEASAKMAVEKLGLLQDRSKSGGRSSIERTKPAVSATTYPPEQLRIVRSRVKEILSNRRNGLWGTRIPHEYKEKYKDEPPPDLLDMIKQWNDIARVELVAATDRDIVYPVLEDITIYREPDEEKPIEKPVKKEDISKEKIDAKVKDLIALHKDTVKKQNQVLKSLVVPREDLLILEQPATVYMTYIYNPGYFFVQREDSFIDEMSEELQKSCQSKSAPEFKDLEKGQFCAGIYSGDENWTRAEILQVKESPPSVELLFLDYGNVETTSAGSIRWLSPETAKVPVQAVNCSLCGILPLETETEWSSKVSKEFAELVREEALIAIPKEIYDDNIYDIELYLKSDPTVSISQKLVDLGVVRTVAKPITEEEEDDMPDLVWPDGNQWDVYITYVTSTNSVMLRLVGEDYSDKLDAYAATLESAFKDSSSEVPIVMGQTYIAYDDELYHRVRALSQEGRKVTCYFPDHGDTDWQIPEQLKPLDPEINKLLPYQAIEVSLYGLEEVATNVTALSKLCDLALANTCVAEVVERDDIPTVILYDTSQDEDVNINEAILQAVRDDDGGIDTPRTQSPAPGSTSSTPKRVISPWQSTTNVTADKTSSSLSVKSSNSQSSDSLSAKDSAKVSSARGSSNKINSKEINSEPVVPVSQTVNVTETAVVDSGNNSDSGNKEDSGTDLISFDKGNVAKDISRLDDEIPDDAKQSVTEETETIPRFTASWTSPSSVKDEKKEAVDYNSNVNSTEDSIKSEQIQSVLNNNVVDTLESLSLSTENESSDSGIENMVSVTRQWSLDGRNIWNPVEYSKRPLPPNFEIPPIGDYLDVHVNFIHDPSNFVCIPYRMMNDLNQLLINMIDFFNPAPAPIIKKEDIKLGHLYAGHKDGVWYRIKIKQFVSDDLLSVYLVDIGEFSVLMLDEVQPLPWTFWKLPFQAITAKLGCVQPISGSWSEAAKYKFIDLAREKDLIGLVLDDDKDTGVASFSLIDTSDMSVDLCVDECLVKMNFAVYCQEYL